MFGAIGPSAATSSTGGDKPTAGLEVQLARYKSKLSDWVNCPSCKTAEGKVKIAEFTAKISEIKQRLEASAAAQQIIRRPATDAALHARMAQRADVLTLNARDVSVSAPTEHALTVGSRLSVYA